MTRTTHIIVYFFAKVKKVGAWQIVHFYYKLLQFPKKQFSIFVNFFILNFMNSCHCRLITAGVSNNPEFGKNQQFNPKPPFLIIEYHDFFAIDQISFF